LGEKTEAAVAKEKIYCYGFSGSAAARRLRDEVVLARDDAMRRRDEMPDPPEAPEPT